MRNYIQHIVIPTVIFGALFSALLANAAPDARAFVERWQPKPDVVIDQAQVVYYRTQASEIQQVALITVNGKLHAALLPGTYTRVCVKPGSYTLGSSLDLQGAQPTTRTSFQTTVKPGKTYFVRVNAQDDGKPQPVRRIEAERELFGLRLQDHVLSRANAVTECRYQSQPLAEINTR